MIGKLKEKTGAISIFTIIVLVFLLPFAFWVGVELPKMHEANQRVKDAVDSSASSAVTLIMESLEGNGNQLANGQLHVSTAGSAEIKHTAKEILALKMGLDYNRSNERFTTRSGSSIINEGENEIEVIVRTIDDTKIPIDGKFKAYSEVLNKDKNGVVKSGWTKEISNPTVIVEAKITFKKIGFFGKNVTVNQVGMSQVNLAKPMK